MEDNSKLLKTMADMLLSPNEGDVNLAYGLLKEYYVTNIIDNKFFDELKNILNNKWKKLKEEDLKL